MRKPRPFNCTHCGSPSTSRSPHPKFCSIGCRNRAKPSRGKRPNRRRGQMVVCVYCSKEFWAIQTVLDSKARTGQPFYCSKRCWKSHTTRQFNCEVCDKRVVVPNSSEKRRFCGHHCYGRWVTDNYFGEKHHSWKGGVSFRGEDWLRQRRRCLRRDGYRCRNCHKHRDELGPRQISVHHRRKYRLTLDNSLDNLVTLCMTCHPLVEHGKIPCPP